MVSGLIDAQFLVTGNFDFGKHLERCLEAQRLAVSDVQVGDAGLGDGHQLLLLRLLLKIAGNERLDHLALDLLGEPLLDHGGGHLTAAKAGKTGDVLHLPDDVFGFAGDSVGGNLDLDLAAGGGVGLGCAQEVCSPYAESVGRGYDNLLNIRRELRAVKPSCEF